MKYYKVIHNGRKRVMDSGSIAILQLSGSKVKVKHQVYKCPNCGSWGKYITGCTQCGFDASEVDIY